jgi:hypothetical protein
MSAFQRRSALVGPGATPHNRIPKPFPAPCQPPATRVPGNGSTQATDNPVLATMHD